MILKTYIKIYLIHGAAQNMQAQKEMDDVILLFKKYNFNLLNHINHDTDDSIDGKISYMLFKK